MARIRDRLTGGHPGNVRAFLWAIERQCNSAPTGGTVAKAATPLREMLHVSLSDEDEAMTSCLVADDFIFYRIPNTDGYFIGAIPVQVHFLPSIRQLPFEALKDSGESSHAIIFNKAQCNRHKPTQHLAIRSLLLIITYNNGSYVRRHL